MPKRKRGVHRVQRFDKVPNVKHLLSSRPAQIASILNIPLPIVQMILQYANDNFFSTLNRDPAPIQFRLGAKMNRMAVDGNVIAFSNETKVMKFDLNSPKFATEFFLEERGPVSSMWIEPTKTIRIERANKSCLTTPEECETLVFPDGSVVRVSKIPVIRIEWKSNITTTEDTCGPLEKCQISQHRDHFILSVGRHIYFSEGSSAFKNLVTTDGVILHWIHVLHSEWSLIVQTDNYHGKQVECFSPRISSPRTLYGIKKMYQIETDDTIALLCSEQGVLIMNLITFNYRFIWYNHFDPDVRYFYLFNQYVLILCTTRGHWEIIDFDGQTCWKGLQPKWTYAHHTIDGRPVFWHRNWLTIWT